MQQVFLAVEILRYFCLDLGASKEEYSCVNGRRKRVKSFIPFVQMLVKNCVLFLQKKQEIHVVTPYDSVFSSFFCFITALFKCVVFLPLLHPRDSRRRHYFCHPSRQPHRDSSHLPPLPPDELPQLSRGCSRVVFMPVTNQ